MTPNPVPLGSTIDVKQSNVVGSNLLNYKERTKKRALECIDYSYKTLSAAEQDLVHRDFRGTNEVFEEKDNFIADKLSELEKEIGLLDEDLTSAYREAVATERQHCDAAEEDKYITSRKFRLAFLRSEQYDAQMAARRLAGHFREKLEIFGREKLACRIRRVDLNAEDKAILASGFLCITGATDKYGRLIVIYRRKQLYSSATTCKAGKRATYYILQNAIEDNEVSQKKGFVLIYYCMGSPKSFSPSRVKSFYPLIRLTFRSLPFRIAGLHLCYDSLKEHFFFALALIIFPKSVRSRALCHYEETPKKSISELKPFGIDPSDIPVTEEGDFRIDPNDVFYLDKTLHSGENREKND